MREDEATRRRAEIRGIERRLGSLDRALRHMDLRGARPDPMTRFWSKIDEVREFLEGKLRDDFSEPDEPPVPASREAIERESALLHQRLAALSRDKSRAEHEAAAVSAMAKESARGTAWVALPQVARNRKDCPIKSVEALRVLRDRHSGRIKPRK